MGADRAEWQFHASRRSQLSGAAKSFANVSAVGLIISRMSQSALQREQAQLTQNNQKELESVKAQLSLRTQNELESAKAALTESTQRRLEELKEELQRRAKVAGHVGENRFKACEVLTTGYKNVAVQIYAYQRLAEDRDWAAANHKFEVKRIASLLSDADKRFDAYTLYFDGLALKEIMTIYAELMKIVCDDIENRERLDRINGRMSMLFTLLRQQLGIEPLSLDVDLIQKVGENEEK